MGYQNMALKSFKRVLKTFDADVVIFFTFIPKV